MCLRKDLGLGTADSKGMQYTTLLQHGGAALLEDAVKHLGHAHHIMREPLRFEPPVRWCLGKQVDTKSIMPAPLSSAVAKWDVGYYMQWYRKSTLFGRREDACRIFEGYSATA